MDSHIKASWIWILLLRKEIFIIILTQYKNSENNSVYCQGLQDKIHPLILGKKIPMYIHLQPSKSETGIYDASVSGWRRITSIKREKVISARTENKLKDDVLLSVTEAY